MELYLVQHGASRSEAEDPQRSLRKRTLERMAERLSTIGLSLDRIDEVDALRIWREAKPMNADMREGIGISISKIESALRE